MYFFLLEGYFCTSLALRGNLSVTTCYDFKNKLSAIITLRELNILIHVFPQNLL